MAKVKKEKDQEAELSLEENENSAAEDTDAAEEVVIVDEQDKEALDKARQAEFDKKIKDMQDRMATSDAERKSAMEATALARKERDEAIAKSHGSQNDVVTAKERELSTVKVALDNEVASLEDSYEKALIDGDSKKLREVNTKLQKAIVKQSQVEDQQIAFTNWKKQQEEQAKAQAANPQPVMKQATQDWITKNPRFNTDPEFNAEAKAAHYSAINRGIVPDSVAYFNFIDKRLETLFPSKKDEDEEDTPPPKTNGSSGYSAPPSRAGGGGSDTGAQTGKKTYRLTAEQREAAEISGMTDVEYAKHLEDLKKQGRIK